MSLLVIYLTNIQCFDYLFNWLTVYDYKWELKSMCQTDQIIDEGLGDFSSCTLCRNSFLIYILIYSMLLIYRNKVLSHTVGHKQDSFVSIVVAFHVR